MTTEEFSNEFDVLLSSYSTQETGLVGGPLEFSEYEKSIFLTRAQEEVVISIYDGKNPLGESFENTEETRRSLSPLIKTYTTNTAVLGQTGLSQYSKFYNLPADLWYITYESVTLSDPTLGCLNNKEAIVIPVTQDAYYKINKNPFRGASDKRALRLDAGNNIVEIVSKYTTSKYLIRYLSKPAPIIIVNLPDNLSINGISIKTECELNPVMHKTILERAIQLALSSRIQTGK